MNLYLYLPHTHTHTRTIHKHASQMSDHEREAFEALRPHGSTPATLARALYDRHGVMVRSGFGLLVGVCESYSAANSHNGAEAAVKSIKQAIEAQKQTPAQWKQAQLTRLLPAGSANVG